MKGTLGNKISKKEIKEAARLMELYLKMTNTNQLPKKEKK